MNILIAKINSTQMQGIDAFSYLLQLRKVLFTEAEQKQNFRVSIIRENTPNAEEQVARPKAILALRVPVGETKVVRYFLYYPNQPLVEIAQENLQQFFDEQQFEYIAKEDPRIPGIAERRL